MVDLHPIRLLILEESQNRAEELIVLLRNAGKATRAHQIESVSDFVTKVSEQKWDLILASPAANGCTAQALISQLKTMDQDIPIVLLADNRDPASITEGLKMGAVDVALLEDDERLALIIERELKNLDSRRQKRRAEVELRETDRRNSLLLDSSTTAIAYVHEGMHIYANQAYVELFGYEDVDEYAGIPIIDLISEEDQVKFKSFLKSFDANESTEEEFSCVDHDGLTILTTMTMSHVYYEGEPCTQVMFRSLVDDSQLENRIKEISSQDLLTGLFNRQHFIKQLASAVNAANEGKQDAILFYIQVDNFPGIRSEAGISNADLVLGDLAALMRNSVPEELLMARFGDDVFTLLMLSGNKSEAEEQAEIIRKSVENHVSDVSGKNYQTTVSIGLSVIAENTATVEEAISRAQQAADAIEDGNGSRIYEPANIKVGDSGKTVSADTLKELLFTALNENAFKLVYQPIVSLHGDDEEQFEVLLRLPDSDGNVMTPGQFLTYADEAGLLPKIDRWVVLQSVKQLAEQRDGGGKGRLFINISHRSIADQEFLPWMSVALKAARLPSDSITLQIHENDVISYIKHAAKFTKGLQELNLKSSINHFGCSLNPFNLLKHLTPDFVKLDGSYAVNIEQSDRKQAELVEIIKQLQATGVLTAISGVEDPAALPTLFMTGINYIQGNYLSEPLDDLEYDFSTEDL